MRSGLPALAAFIASLLLWPSSSRADFQVCNLTTSPAEVAFGYYEPQDGWSSRGWLRLQLGECKIALRGPLQHATYYIYGRSEDGREFAGPSSQNGGFFCIQKPKFELHLNALTNGQALNCEASGLKTVRFVEVKVTNQDYTYTLTPSLGQIGNMLAPLIREGLQMPSGNNSGTGTKTYFPNAASTNPPEPPIVQAPPPPVARTQASSDPSTPSNPSKPSPAGTACERFPNLC